MYKTRQFVMSEHINHKGVLFGGRALMWLDAQSAIFAASLLNSNSVVTKYMSKIDFEASAKLGDLVEIQCWFLKTGTTSITVGCKLINVNTGKTIISVDEVVLVNIGSEGKPVPHETTIEIANQRMKSWLAL